MIRARTNPYVLTAASASLLLAGCLERELKPLNPCLVSSVASTIQVKNIDQVDLLFMVDNSNSMRDEQVALRQQFGPLIKVLTTGDRDGDGIRDFPPAKDLHLGVVSSDMGLVNVDGVELCKGFGDDGILLNEPSPELDGCRADIPKFLSFEVEKDDPFRTAHDFACIATLGTGGCGIEQQLEAPLKALWPSIDPMPKDGKNRIAFAQDVNGFGGLGHGDMANAGFLRNNPPGQESLLAIIVVTDEEDCSTGDTQTFNRFPDASSPLAQQHLNLRCFHNPERLYPLSRYIEGFKELRPNNKDLVIFGAIVGVPPDLVKPEVYDQVNWKDKAQVDAFYKRILDDSRMQERIDTNLPPMATPTLVPSCTNGPSAAYPPRRIVEVARGFGANGSVHSICENDFGPAMDRIIALISEKLGAVCLPRPLVRDREGIVGCNVVWELPKPGSAVPGIPVSCADRPFLRVPEGRETVSQSGGAVCEVAQLAVIPDATAPGGLKAVPTIHDGVMFTEGWFYDDFSEERKVSCKAALQDAPPQRVAFSPSASPPTGVLVKLECLNEAQSLAQSRLDLSPSFKQPKIGDACNQAREGEPRTDADACIVHLAAPTAMWPEGIDTSMFCHPEQNICVLACHTDADCPAAWVCDARAETLAATADPAVHANGSAICVNPTCGGSKD